MATLITGSGLIGASFGQFAAERGERLVFVDFQPRDDYLKQKLGDADYVSLQGDVLDLPALTGIIKAHDVDTVLHTAAIIAGRVAREGYWAFNVNIQGTINVAEAARLTGVKRVVQISTLGVYNRAFEGSGAVPETLQRGDSSAYGNSKAVQELVLEAYQGLFGFELMMVRLAHVFGLGHFQGGAESGAITHTLLDRGRHGGVARVARRQARPLERIYAKDVGRAVDLAATVPVPPVNVFNIGTGLVTTFDELVEEARAIYPDLEVEVVPDGTPYEGPKQPLDITRAREHLGWEPRFTLGSALRDYVKDLDALESGA
ncbi:MAG: NAD(P)-dependent oxidoreductase [Deltaproteobacteria bacterium]|nr:NAD(P)-dependent oxidoreductase [Deltaproteobacteria bacterium]